MRNSLNLKSFNDHLYSPSASGWFTGLSASFLNARTARLLVLAGTDRLDKELMIGQMQGKFQMVVVPSTGHMLHEVCLVNFLSRCRPNPRPGRSRQTSRDPRRILETQRACSGGSEESGRSVIISPRSKRKKQSRSIPKCILLFARCIPITATGLNSHHP